MQAQLVKKTENPPVQSSPKEQRLRIAELLHDEPKKVTKLCSESSPTDKNSKKRPTSDQPKSSTSIPYNASSNDQEYKPKDLASKNQIKKKKKCRTLPISQPHAICLNHITAQPFCSISAKEIFNAYPKYYKTKKRFVLNWLRKNFGRTAKPKAPSTQESTSESSDSDSSSDTDEDTTTETDTETVVDALNRPQKKQRTDVSENSEESTSELSSDSETTSEST